MLAPTSTRNGACCTARGDISTRGAQRLFDEAGERRRLLEIARLRRLPQNQIDGAIAAAERRQRRGVLVGSLAGLGVGALDGQVVDLGALHRRPHRGVGVDAEEHVGLLVVGERRSIVERHRAIVLAGQEHPQPEAAFDQRAQAPRDRERDLFFERALRALRAELVAAMAGIDHDRAQAGRGALGWNHEPRIRRGRGRRRRRRRIRRRRQQIDRQAARSGVGLRRRDAVQRVARPQGQRDRRRRVARRDALQEAPAAAPAEC